jgi:mycothione reductase
MTHVDLAIIGSGSGNTIGTHDFNSWSIAIIEEGVFGGTCVNVGCIPTKMYVYPADLAASVDHARRLGVNLSLDSADWTAIRDRIFTRIDAIAASGREFRHSGRPNTQLIESRVEFVDAHTLRAADGSTITAENIVIAAGGRPVVPAVVAASGVPFHTSDTVMRIDTLPERLIVLGGGYIAAEFAHIFSAFGSQVTLLARSAPLLRHLDHEIAQRFTDVVSQRWDVRLGADITGVHRDGNAITVALADGTSVTGDLLLVATGREPNSDRLNLDAAGIQTHSDGRIAVDEYQRTTADGVWALGDISSPYQLKHVANHEARVVAHNLLHPDAMIRSDHRFVPAAVFTNPQLASVGMTETEAMAAGRHYVTYTHSYGSTAFGWAMEDSTGACKVIADRDTGQLLGAHVLGEQAATLIQPLIQAMSFGLSARVMARAQYWIHPALPEVVENALLHLDLPRLDWEEPRCPEPERPDAEKDEKVAVY